MSVSFPQKQIGAFVVLIVFWALLYLPHLRTSPSWYGDETIALDIALNMTRGELAFAGLWNTFFTIVYQPIYEGWIALWLIVAGPDILAARSANVTIALAIAVLLWLLVQRVVEESQPSGRNHSRSEHLLTLGFAGALTFLALTPTVLHFRMVYPHNGVVLGLTLSALALSLKHSVRSDLLIGLGNLVALGSHPIGVFGALALAFPRLLNLRSWLFIVLIPGSIFLTLYLIPGARFGSWLIEDFFAIFESYGDYTQQNQGRLFVNIWSFFTTDAIHAVGFIGALTIPLWKRSRPLWPFTLLFSVYCAALFSNRSNLPVFYYQAIILLPAMAVGTACIITVLTERLLSLIKNKPAIAPELFALLFPILLALSLFPVVLNGELRSKNHYWATQNTSEVETVAEWLNSRSDDGDLVITNSNLGWLLDANYANLLQLTAWHGHPTFMHEKGTPQERFRFDLKVCNIHYVAVGDIDQRWTFAQPRVLDTLTELGITGWPIVWQGANYIILQNPSMIKPSRSIER